MGYALSMFLADGKTQWVVQTIPDSGVKPLTNQQAETIARVFGDVVGVESTPSPFEIVRDGIQSARKRVEEELQIAEQWATKVPALRKQLAEVGGPKQETT